MSDLPPGFDGPDRDFFTGSSEPHRPDPKPLVRVPDTMQVAGMNRTSATGLDGRVQGALLEIPAGRVTTYKLLAERIGCGSPRAVGQALKRNPRAPEVPCHRVIRSDLTAGGYSGRTEGPDLARKLGLLESEGISFDPVTGRLRDPSRLFRFGT